MRHRVWTFLVDLALGPLLLAFLLLAGAAIGSLVATPVFMRAIRYDGNYAIQAIAAGYVVGLVGGAVLWCSLNWLRRCACGGTTIPTPPRVSGQISNSVAALRQSSTVAVVVTVAAAMLTLAAGGYLALGVAHTPPQFKLGPPSIEPLPQTQHERQAIITDLLATGVFSHIEDHHVGAVTVWTGPAFAKLQTIEKQRYGRLLFDYYFSNRSSIFDGLFIHDGDNFQEIGTVTARGANFYDPINHPRKPKAP